MTPDTEPDPEYPETMGRRTDGRNLIEEWQQLHQEYQSAYVWNKDQFDAINPDETDFLLGTVT